jgi:predicted regulator of Ras-like GTPase activity (Roadblock/LC7/MglB family)
MTHGRDSLHFSEELFGALTQSLQRFVEESGCNCTLLVDRSGQLVTTIGGKPGFDTTAFASLTAADFSANDQLARLLGEHDFTSLFHEGEKESMYMAGVAGRLILVVLFDSGTAPGMVRLSTRKEVEELTRICEQMLAESTGDSPSAHGILAGADDEIDQLFR